MSTYEKPAGWGKKEFSTPDLRAERFGPLTIWHKALSGDLWLAWDYQEDPSTPCRPPDEDKDPRWSRWALKGKHKAIRFTPIFPDRPVVVQPEFPFLLTPKAEARAYIECPLWVCVAAGENSEEKIEEVPTVVLSNTWQGTFFEGDLCYWLSSPARRDPQSFAGQPHTATCPIHIKNESDEELKVERICLRVGWLGIYDKEGRLWSDASHVSYRGTNEVSQVEAKGRAPREAQGAKLAAKPREGGKRGLASTFSHLKSLPGMGLFGN